jgi:hypothetical protein
MESALIRDPGSRNSAYLNGASGGRVADLSAETTERVKLWFAAAKMTVGSILRNCTSLPSDVTLDTGSVRRLINGVASQAGLAASVCAGLSDIR